MDPQQILCATVSLFCCDDRDDVGKGRETLAKVGEEEKEGGIWESSTWEGASDTHSFIVTIIKNSYQIENNYHHNCKISELYER